MRFVGTITELDIDLDEFHFEIGEAVVTKNRIAMDWEEDGEEFHAALTSSDGIGYEGHYGSPVPDKKWTIQATKYTAADKRVLLLVKWFQTDNGNEGASLIELEPGEE